MSGSWVALLSGGKDSNWALYRALERGLEVSHVLAAQPDDDSYLFHVPATELTEPIAESVGLPYRSFPVASPGAADAGAVGDAELDALSEALEADRPDALAGVISGAVESEFQHDRLARLCERFGIEQFSPLWGVDPEPALRRMLEHGFDIRVVAVAAAGLDETWLGRRLDHAAVDELVDLAARFGLHVLGEGGEYETIVVDGPHMDGRLAFDAEPHWDGLRGHLEISNARLVG